MPAVFQVVSRSSGKALTQTDTFVTQFIHNDQDPGQMWMLTPQDFAPDCLIQPLGSPGSRSGWIGGIRRRDQAGVSQSAARASRAGVADQSHCQPAFVLLARGQQRSADRRAGRHAWGRKSDPGLQTERARHPAMDIPAGICPPPITTQGHLSALSQTIAFVLGTTVGAQSVWRRSARRRRSRGGALGFGDANQ